MARFMYIYVGEATDMGDMTEEQAMALMVDGAWQEQDEARGKWLRARISSTQLSTYFVGSLEMWDLEMAVRERLAEAAGAGAEAVPQQHIRGGVGDSPGFAHSSGQTTIHSPSMTCFTFDRSP